MNELTERAALLLGLAEALNEREAGICTAANYNVVQSNRNALGLEPSGHLAGVDEVTYLNGFVAVTVNNCTCAMGGLEEAAYYGHESGCGLEMVGYADSVAWSILRNDYEKAGNA